MTSLKIMNKEIENIICIYTSSCRAFLSETRPNNVSCFHTLISNFHASFLLTGARWVFHCCYLTQFTVTRLNFKLQGRVLNMNNIRAGRSVWWLSCVLGGLGGQEIGAKIAGHSKKTQDWWE